MKLKRNFPTVLLSDISNLKQLFSNSIIEKIIFNGNSYYVKRDDLIHPVFNGNKARKLFFLKDLKIKKIISFGGTQSNMLPVLSFFAEMKNIPFIYCCKPISTFQKEHPEGNYKAALKNTAFKEIPHEDWQETVKDLKAASLDNDGLLINQGGLQKESEKGLKLLAEEIKEWAEKEKIEDLKIFLPSGTGTTALFLQKNLNFDVFTTPCVGDKEYLTKQLLEVEKDLLKHPKILDLDKKYNFGKPYKEFFEIYRDLKSQTRIEFELLYDAKGWIVLEKFRESIGKNILYIHQGGTLGNESMLERYRKLFS